MLNFIPALTSTDAGQPLGVAGAAVVAGLRRPELAGADERRGTGDAVVAVCRAAVARWFRCLDDAWLKALLVAVRAIARWTARPQRPASLDGQLLLRGMRRDTWFRTARLMETRAVEEFGRARPGPKSKKTERLAPPAAEQIDKRVQAVAEAEWRQAFTTTAARQMIKHLGEFADAAGRIDDVGHMIASYRAKYRCSEETAYQHWKVMWQRLGLVRQTRASNGQRLAVGDRCARYVLAWPAARLPGRLPHEADGHGSAPLADGAAAWDEFTDAALYEAADIVAVRYGSCRAAQTRAHAPATGGNSPADDHLQSSPAYYLQAVPLYARASPPSPPGSGRGRGGRSGQRRPGGLTDKDRAQARAILSRCRSRWAEQGHHPSEDDLAQLIGLVALCLRYTAHLDLGDLVDVLTERVRTARDLPGLLTFRLQRLINSLRHQANLEVDDTGDLYAVKVTDRARFRAEIHQQTAEQRAQTRAAALAAKQRRRADWERDNQRRLQALREVWPETVRPGTGQQAAPEVPPYTGPLVEPEHVFAAEQAARTGHLPAGRGGRTMTELAALQRARSRRASSQQGGPSPAPAGTPPAVDAELAELQQAVVNARAAHGVRSPGQQQRGQQAPPVGQILPELDHLPAARAAAAGREAPPGDDLPGQDDGIAPWDREPPVFGTY